MNPPKTSAYYRDTARFEHPEITEEAAHEVIRNPEHTVVQDNGRIQHYGEVTFADGSRTMYVRVITLPDGETLDNAFPDKRFTTLAGSFEL